MTGSRIRKFFKVFFIVLDLLFCSLFLLSCLTPYVNPVSWWFFGFLSLAVPYLILILIFSIIFWLIIKPKFVFIPLVCLLIGWKHLSVVFAWHLKTNFTDVKADSVLRIVDWNVASMYGLSQNTLTRFHDRMEIAQLILSENPDIICLQEFSHSDTQGSQAENIELFSSKYPYYFFSKDQQRGNGYYLYGSVIFSKFPMVDTGRTTYLANAPEHESLIYLDIRKGEDTIRVYTAHLQSFEFSPSDYENIEKIKQPGEESLQASKSVASKMKLAFTRRGTQADIIKNAIDKSPYPSIMCGDFNDVPNSYTYMHIRGNRQDAFLASSFGIGRTFNTLAPTLRIDYILPDEHFNVNQFEIVDEGLSDHRMLVTDLSLKK